MGECICRDEWTDGSEAVGKGGLGVGWWWGSRVGGGLDRMEGMWVVERRREGAWVSFSGGRQA